MKKVSVTIAIPVVGKQDAEWWGPTWALALEWQRGGIEIHGPITASAAMPCVAKNNAYVAWTSGKNLGLTAANRNRLAGMFTTEWLYFIDHDTVPTLDTLPRLLMHDYKFVAGVYHLRNEPHGPLVYRKQPSGFYRPVVDYDAGTIFQEPGMASGLGCALIHRDVFDAIQDQYEVLQRPNGSLKLVHRDDFYHENIPSRLRKKSGVYESGGTLHEVRQMSRPDEWLVDKFNFPFFDMENNRTEDLGFCERAERAGYPVRIDTSIQCSHLQLKPITGEHWGAIRTQAKIAGIKENEDEH